MAWKDSSRGQFTRPLGENEYFIKLVGIPGKELGRSNWSVNSSARVSPHGSLANAGAGELISLFRTAWQHLRFHHPTLAATLDDTRNVVSYRVPADAAALEKWTDETFFVVHNLSADEHQPFVPLGPCATLTYLPLTNELLGHSAHWRCDGVGVVMLLDHLIELAALGPDLPSANTLAWGQEPARLAPPVEEALATPALPDEGIVETAQRLVETFYQAAGAIGIAYTGDASTPASPASCNARLRLDAAQTAAVVAACKARGLSVTSAVHASVGKANYVHAEPDMRGRHYTSTIRFSLRPWISEKKFGTRDFAGVIYTTGWMHAAPAGAAWTDMAAEYNGLYRAGLNEQFVRSHREYAARLGKLVEGIPPGGEPPSDVDISSMGLMERYIAREKGNADHGFTVQHVSIGVEYYVRQVMLYLWTFRDQMEFNTVFNTAYHEKDKIEAFNETVKKILFEELDIKV